MDRKQIIQLIDECKKDPRFFITNFCSVKHPLAGELKFDLFSYQDKTLDAFKNNRFNLFRKCRQSGISTLAGVFALWYAMFYPDKTILIVSKRDEDAKTFLDRNIVYPYDHLPKWMQKIWSTVAKNEHSIRFSNGSLIKSLTSSAETLRSNASSLNIIDEAGFIDEMEDMWASGWSCAALPTLISTSNGLIPIGNLGNYNGDKWQDTNINVHTDNGVKNSDKFYVNGYAPVINISTKKFEFKFTATENHRLRVIDGNGDYVWRYMRDIKIGDCMVLKPDTHTGERQKLTPLPNVVHQKREFITDHKHYDKLDVTCACGHKSNIYYRSYKDSYKKHGCYKCSDCLNNEMSPNINNVNELTPELAEILGYVVGDGSVSLDRPKRVRVYLNKNDERDVAELVAAKIDKLFGTKSSIVESGSCVVVTTRSSKLVDFLIHNDLVSKTSALDCEIPNAILKSDRDVVYGFLRGLFTADGWNYKTKYVNSENYSVKTGFSTSSLKLADQVHQLLLSIGILASREIGVNTKGRFSEKPSYRVNVFDLCNKQKFQKLVGFNGAKKDWISENNTNAYKIDHKILVEEFSDKALEKLSAVTKQPVRFAKESGSITYNLWERCVNECQELNDTRLSSYINQGFIFDEVGEISHSHADTVDISVPDGNTYIANGFVSHNTLQHGGSVIVISTPNGIGGWYHSKCIEAEMGQGIFNVINIKWYDMDWSINFIDPLSGKDVRLAPTDNMIKCTTKEMIEKYGEYWSPWLEEQYKALQSKGESHKFRQEVLGEFIGGGGTIIDGAYLHQISQEIDALPKPEIPTKPIIHTNPMNGANVALNFAPKEQNDGLYVWDKPVLPVSTTLKNGNIIQTSPGHNYIMGVDVATGENNDYSAIVIVDLDTQSQVAEYIGKVSLAELAYMTDYLGRFYNNALAVIDATAIGKSIIQPLVSFGYPRLWRKKEVGQNGSITYGKYGFIIGPTTKEILNKHLIQYLTGDDGTNIKIKSRRLLKQLQIYIRFRDKSGVETKKSGAQKGVGNNDDLVTAVALCFIGIPDCSVNNNEVLMPMQLNTDLGLTNNYWVSDQQDKGKNKYENDNQILMPYSDSDLHTQYAPNPEAQINNFAGQLMSNKIIVPRVIIKKPLF